MFIRMLIGLAATVTLLPWQAAAQTQPRTLYRYDGAVSFDGRFGPVAQAQSAVKQALDRCGLSLPITVDGRFGRQTQDALSALANCREFAGRLGAEERRGVLTDRFWSALLPGEAAPGVDSRARTLMLTYEATDYTRAEWNFCQSRPLYNPAAGQTVCYSNDRQAFLTWGPNGATAGLGHEVQFVLRAFDRAEPTALESAFQAEAPAVRRMLALPARGRILEIYLCGVWAAPTRRAAWREGFERLGGGAALRRAYDEVYRSASFDGGKIAAFQRAYGDRRVTEIDYAFFKDRAAHMTVSEAAVREAIAAALRADPDAQPWQVRRAIAQAVRPTNQRQDRLGRDVAFYVDGAAVAQLTAEEQAAWRARGGLRASSFGLSDTATAERFTARPAIGSPVLTGELTEAERRACPAAVLATVPPQ